MKLSALLAFLLSLSLLLSGCAGTVSSDSASGIAPPSSSPEDAAFPGKRPSVEPDASPVIEGQELYCLAENREEALAAAEEYGIELVRFAYGVAVFHAEGDLSALLQRGIENGWHEMALNRSDKTLN